MTDDEPTKDLTEDLPKSLTDSEKLDWLMETMQRFLARDTNPLPPNYDARFTALEERLARIERELVLLREDIRNERHERVIPGERVTTLESRPS